MDSADDSSQLLKSPFSALAACFSSLRDRSCSRAHVEVSSPCDLATASNCLRSAVESLIRKTFDRLSDAFNGGLPSPYRHYASVILDDEKIFPGYGPSTSWGVVSCRMYIM